MGLTFFRIFKGTSCLGVIAILRNKRDLENRITADHFLKIKKIKFYEVIQRNHYEEHT